MDEIYKLQKEVDDLRKLLQKKEELLSRLKNERGIKQNDETHTIHNEPTNILLRQLSDESSSKASVMSWTPDMQTNDHVDVFKASIENTVFTNTQASEQSFGMGIPKGYSDTVHNGSWSGQSQEMTANVTETKVVTEEAGAKAQIGKTLPRWAIERYSRQILLPDIGVSGQEKLCAARVLIVGAGGLGCPAAVYLAGAGIGEIGIVDYDTVDLTNIHRQFLHGEKDQFVSKAESAANSLRSINSRIKVTPYNVQLNSENAIHIASQYDIVLDCTDNVPTRYLLNDLCVLTKLPLVSGSALKMEGQLTVYGYRANKNPNEKESSYIGPCYRCVFPSPPPAAAVGSCSAHGVAGPVPGTIGALQALEAMKYIIGQQHSRLLVQRMLLFDADDVTFRTVTLRPRNPHCVVCSDSPTVDRLMDYELFCKAQAKEKKKDSRLKSGLRKREKQKRMNGQSYYGFRTRPDGTHTKWYQDVPKSERKMGPPCKSEICAKGTLKKCTAFDESKRSTIFAHFWNELDWIGKKNYVRGLVDSVPVKRRRSNLKGVSRKGDSKLYHLLLGDQKIPVCRVMFLNTLAIKEATLRCWLVTVERPKARKKAMKSINVDSYIDSLPKIPPKCEHCINSGTKIQYINLLNVKNLYQLYNMYKQDMKLKNSAAASRKTFSKVINLKNIRVFKTKNESDVCDVKEHNALPNLSYSEENVGYYYDVNQW